VCFAQQAADIDKLWEDANAAYTNADYGGAIRGYNAIMEAGYVSHKLYYNLGNAYFKDNDTGRSILFYNRALLLKPGDKDTRYNLEIASGRVKDKIDAVPEFFIARWVKGVRSTMGSNGGAVLSLVLLGLALGATLVYMLAGKLALRKAGFYTGICSFAVMALALVFSISERHEILNSPEAIVMSSAAPVKSSPDSASRDLFILHEGTKLRVVSSLGEWREVEIASGDKGWIASTAIETVR
jgi:tetratricopeptide (TPR) repeat protein